MFATRAAAFAMLCFAALAPTLAPTAAGAAVVAQPNLTVFSFAGVCTDCSGIGRGELTLANYTAGQSISTDNFVSFHYDGSNLISAFTITNVGNGYYGGAMVAPFPNSNETIYASDAIHFFQSYNRGWRLGEGSFVADYGATYTWDMAAATAVPEPATAALLLAGLAGTAAVRRRRAAA